ncbi:MAG: phytanoyl-CoA dioxygenase family protein [Gammaproteobacteria bacterium]|nr:phytanoyl-CoA dioxygenase family protein [Gammaproteobacteria bacterium]
MLTPEQIEQYREDGYCVPDYRLSDETLEQIRALHEQFVARHPNFRDYCPAILCYDTSFLAFARDPKIVEMVGQVIGPDFALWNSSFFAKPAKNGRKTPWHQDGEYWPIRPVATCTVWMAIDDSTTENGCLRVIRGSHKRAELLAHETNSAPDLTLNQELPTSAYDESQAVDLVLEAGQMSLHDVFLVHGSEQNTSPNSRRGMTLRYMPLTSVFDRELAGRQYHDLNLGFDHTERTLFLMRGDDQTGRNDFRLRM